MTTGSTESSKCGCKAGLPGVCSHVGALLLTINKIHIACTSFMCEWKKTRAMQKRLSPKRLQDIAIVNPEQTKDTPIRAYPSVCIAGPCCDPDTFFEDIMMGLGKVNPSSVLFQTFNPDISDISDILTKYNPSYMFRDSVDLKSNVCQSVSPRPPPSPAVYTLCSRRPRQPRFRPSWTKLGDRETT